MFLNEKQDRRITILKLLHFSIYRSKILCQPTLSPPIYNRSTMYTSVVKVDNFRSIKNKSIIYANVFFVEKFKKVTNFNLPFRHGRTSIERIVLTKVDGQSIYRFLSSMQRILPRSRSAFKKFFVTLNGTRRFVLKVCRLFETFNSI